ncbi:hypothetical protein Tco_0497810 [Tanacetum coccineum]
MAALKFASSHNMFAFLDKPTKSGGFEQIVDFLNAHPIKYALTVNPTIYTACIEQFWTTAKVQTVNGEVQIQALVDKKKVIITKTSIRTDLQLADENGTKCLPNATIFAELERMGLKRNNQGGNRGKTLRFLNLVVLQSLIANEAPNDENVKKGYRTARIESSKDEVLGNQEDASKQGRKIADLDADTEVALVDEAQGRNDDNLMFDTGVLDEQEVEVEVVVSTAEVTTTSATTTTVDELTLAQTLIEIKATITVVLRPKARGVVVQEPSKFTTTTSPSQPSQLPQAKDKGKAKMVEPEKPLKKKDQFLIDEEIAQRLQEELQAELEEEERLARQKEEDANIVEWDNV